MATRETTHVVQHLTRSAVLQPLRRVLTALADLANEVGGQPGLFAALHHDRQLVGECTQTLSHLAASGVGLVTNLAAGLFHDVAGLAAGLLDDFGSLLGGGPREVLSF
jgi:hypothetical protein